MKREEKLKEQEWAKKPRSRLQFFRLLIFFLIVGLLGKLAFIQIVDHDKYISVAERQQRISLEGIDKRGTIYDRNMKPLTGTAEEYVYLIKKSNMNEEAKKVLQSINARRVSSNNDKYTIYCCVDYHERQSKLLREKWDAFVLKAPQRYSEDQLAVHVIGYVNGLDGEGVCGLEKDFDSWLSQRDKVVYAVGDGANCIIPGFGIQNSIDSDCCLVTTLDLDVQKYAEELLGKKRLKGTIIVAEANSGEILACASSPTFHPNEITEYLDSEGKEFLNLATQALYPPGSVFKIVVAAAALENKVATENTSFLCKGYEEINGVKIKCSTGGERGHGRITLREAFAKSCNSAFIQLGEQTGAEAILKMASVIGLDKKTLTGLSGEKKGYLPLLSEVQGAGIGNLSIGQGKLSVTPMEICKMTQIIANGGKSRGLTLVKGTMKKGVLKKFSGKDEVQILSEQTSKKLQSFMEDTVKQGTANNLKGISAGGKTGSAESVEGGKEVVHGWFTGFVPAENPKYVVTVFVEQGGSGRSSAVPLFDEITTKLK